MIRYGRAPYIECSSRGDRRFSAFSARLKDGRSIEEVYQAAKIFQGADGQVWTNRPWQKAKGKKADNQAEVAILYSRLWDRYIVTEHPELLMVLCTASGLSDMFGQPGHVCQATELWRIREHWRFYLNSLTGVNLFGEESAWISLSDNSH